MLLFILGLILGALLVLIFINRDTLAVRYYNTRAAGAAKRANASLAEGDSGGVAKWVALQRKYEAKSAAAAKRMSDKTNLP